MTKRKKKRKFWVLIIIALLPIIVTVCLSAMAIISTLFLMGSVSSFFLLNETIQEIEQIQFEENGTCGCQFIGTVENILGSTGILSTGSTTNSDLSVITSSEMYNSLTGAVATKQNFLAQILPSATLIYETHNILPTTLIGQKILESGWTFSDSVHHNYFGIKATSSWNGGTYTSLAKEYINGKWVTTTATWRAWNTREEGLLGYADFLRTNSRYSSAFETTNYIEQITRIREAGYATDPDYVNKILDIIDPNQFYALNDIESTKQLMKDLGIYEEYETLKNKVMSGEYTVAFTDNLTFATSTSSSSSLIVTSGECLKCTCGSSCSCHDIVYVDNQSGSDLWNMAEASSEGSGVFGSKEYLASLIEQLSDRYQPFETKSVSQLKTNLTNLLQYIGLPSQDVYTYNTDRFTGNDGYGFIHYNQSKNPGEPYVNLPYTDESAGAVTFNSSACGIYSIAMILSTLERKWVNPAEVAIVVQTLPVIEQSMTYTTQMGGTGGALYSSAITKVFNLAGYDNVVYSGYSISQTELDNVLDAGGLAMFTFRNNGSTAITTSTGHFIVVRERTADGKYLLGDSIRREDTAFTFEQLKQSFKHTAVYVYPKANQSVYEVLNSNSTGGTQTNSDAPIHPLQNNSSASSGIFRDNGEFHGGTDYAAPTNTPIYAVWDGSIVGKGYHNDFGYYVTIKHTNGLYSTSAHMVEECTLNVGSTVTAGTQIGKVGNTGSSTGSHLHIEILDSSSKLGSNGLFSTKILYNFEDLLKGMSYQELTRFQASNGKAKVVYKGANDFSQYEKFISLGTLQVGV